MFIRNPWLRYFGCMLTPGLPPIGSPLQADVVIAQAFEILREQNFIPGIVNHKLALLCRRLADHYQLPIIGQWEVMYELYSMDQDWYVKHELKPGRRLISIWPENAEYFTMWHVKSATKAVMELHDWRVPIEVAQSHMIAHAYLVLQKLGLDPVVVDQEVDTFDPHSVQPWTQSWIKWWLREPLSRIAHLLYGWVGPVPPWKS